MNIEDTIWLLAHSSNPEDKREWAVLYWKSQGLKHEEIADKWGYSINWVQRYMTRAYKRFEVPPELNKYEKLQYLEDHVFPLMRKFIANEPDIVRELPPPPTENDPPEEQEQNRSSIGVGQIKNEKTKSVEEPPIIEIRTPMLLPAPTPPIWIKIFRRVFFGLVSLLIVSGIAYFAYVSGRGTIPPPVVVIITATFPPVTDTLLPSATLTVPTNTFVPTSIATEVPTTIPTPTDFSPPADGILFQDDFEAGDLSAWTQVNGKWIVSEGKLTLLADEDVGNDYQWISLNKPAWKNYILSMDLNKSYNNGVAVIVRDNSSTQPIGFEIGWGDDIQFVLVSSNWTDNTRIAGDIDANVLEKSDVNIQVEVQGDTYILRLNGREIQRITFTGYKAGGIAFGVNCTDDRYGCTTFDNIKVTYLP